MNNLCTFARRIMRRVKNQISLLFQLVALAVIMTACSTTRYVPEGEYLLNKVKIVNQESNGVSDKTLSSSLNSHVRQTPNSRWFSLFKLPLATYSLSGRDTTRWLNRTLRNMGEPPVIYSERLTQRTCADLKQELQNEGWLNAEVIATISKRRKKVNVVYHLHPGEPYYIRNISYEIADDQIAHMLWSSGEMNHRLLKEGMQFNVSVLDAERKRLTKVLTDRGYYRFHKEYISYVADTAANSNEIDVTLKLALFHQKDRNDTLHTRYQLRNITYASGNTSDKSIHLRRGVLEECTHMGVNDFYSGSALQQTYNHFGRMQAVKYTNITLRQVPDTSLLDCNISIQTNKPSTISFQPEGTNTAGDLGAAASLTYQNRNLFRGSEVFSIQFRGAYEAIKGLEGYSNQNFEEYSAEARLSFPRFLMPFVGHRLRHSVEATSEVSLLYDMQNRPEFHRRVVSSGLRYKWNFPGHRARYQIDLLDLNYVFMPWISETFRHEYLDVESSRNAILRYNYEDIFITKIGIGYSYSNKDFVLKTNLETSGNVLSSFSRLLGAHKDTLGQYRIFNIAFAQYIKGDIDWTRYVQVDANNQFVFHCGLGVAIPYGNSRVLPFEKRYFSGGANSVRGWSVRSLGPGKYHEHDGRINFINQTGDIKLDLNIEYRTHLFWKLSGALFVDAGNIWTFREYKEQPGGQFRLNELPKQLAVAYGTGLRFNFDYFILRFDLGMKAVNPAFAEEHEKQFPILHPDFKRDYAFHFAVGMPF